MDFHSLARRDLQVLCKKNKIPANLTNLAMADALQALQSIEWDEEVRQKVMPQSETMKQYGSPLPGSRRVSATSSDNSVDEADEMKKEILMEVIQTPATAVRRSQRIQSAMGTRTCARTSASAADIGASAAAGTRTRRSKKDEVPAEAAEAVVVATPAPQRGRKKALETPAPSAIPRSSARPTRQSTRKVAESTKSTRVTRTITNLMALDVDEGKGTHTEVNEVPEKTEQAKEQAAEDVDTTKEEQLVSDEKLNLVEQNEEKIEYTAENITDVSDINAAPVAEEKDETALEKSFGPDKSEGSTEEEFINEISGKKEVHPENSVEEVADIGSDTHVAPISEEEQVYEMNPEKEGGEVNENTLADSPIKGLVSEVVQESNSAPQDAPPCDVITLDGLDSQPCDIITSDAQDAASDLCLSSPVRAPVDVGVDKMLDSVVRRFSKASIDSAKKTDATAKIASEDVPELVQNENAVKVKVDLQGMSLRKLKAMYKDHLTELNSKKVVDEEEEKRLPLGKVDGNPIV